MHILVRFFLAKKFLQFFWMWASEKSNVVLGSEDFDFSNPIYFFIYSFIVNLHFFQSFDLFISLESFTSK